MTAPLAAETSPPSPVERARAVVEDPLSVDTLVDRLEKAEPEVVDDVYELAQRQLAAEDAHGAKLDGRATSLFGAAGFSMTVGFSFGGWALLDHAYAAPLGRWIAVTFVAVLVLGVVASSHALRVLRIRGGQKFIDEAEILHADVLPRTRRDYRIHTATHVWLVWQARYRRNEARARVLQAGQTWFAAFLVGIVLLSVLTTLSALLREPPGMCPSMPNTVAPSSAPPRPSGAAAAHVDVGKAADAPARRAAGSPPVLR